MGDVFFFKRRISKCFCLEGSRALEFVNWTLSKEGGTEGGIWTVDARLARSETIVLLRYMDIKAL